MPVHYRLICLSIKVWIWIKLLRMGKMAGMCCCLCQLLSKSHKPNQTKVKFAHFQGCICKSSNFDLSKIDVKDSAIQLLRSRRNLSHTWYMKDCRRNNLDNHSHCSVCTLLALHHKNPEVHRKLELWLCVPGHRLLSIGTIAPITAVSQAHLRQRSTESIPEWQSVLIVSSLLLYYVLLSSEFSLTLTGTCTFVALSLHTRRFCSYFSHLSTLR